MLIEDVDLIPVKSQKEKRPLSQKKETAQIWIPKIKRAKLAPKEMRIFSSSMANLLEGGVPLFKALQVIRKETAARSAMDELLSRLEGRVSQGSSFSEALASDTLLFPSFYIEMIRAGELTGNLDVILRMLASYMERDEDRRRKIIEAATYPVLVFFVGALTFVVLLKVVIPKIAVVYEDLDTGLPALTRLVLSASDAVLPLTVIFIAGLIAGGLYIKRNQEKATALLLKLPVVGNLLSKNRLAQFSSLMALELQSGMTVSGALESVERTIPDGSFRKDLKTARELLLQGESFSESLRVCGWLPESVLVLIQAGQESGRLANAFEQVRVEASREFDSQVHFFLKLLEPLLILGVGCVVGVIVISAILPILEINTLVR